MAAAYICIVQERENRRVPRPLRDRGNPLQNLSDSEILSRYRLDREAIVELYHILRHELEHPTKGSNALQTCLYTLTILAYFVRFLHPLYACTLNNDYCTT